MFKVIGGGEGRQLYIRVLEVMGRGEERQPCSI